MTVARETPRPAEPAIGKAPVEEAPGTVASADTVAHAEAHADAVAHAEAHDAHHVENPEQRVRLYIWQAPVRLTHWVTAGCIVVLSLTGGYIADPFLIPAGGGVMSTIRLIHIVTALIFLVSGLIRTFYLLFGNRFVRWTAFIPTNKRQFTELFRQAGFYGFVRSEIPEVLGHNQLAASAYVVLFVLLLAETVTGFALDGLMGAEPGATLFGWLRELAGPQLLRQVHHLSMWMILAIALFHIYSCMLVDHIEHNGLVSSIISGWKFPTRHQVVASRDGGPELIDRVEP
jgi:Ni/Fe-hydrogenase 1 B-type cytochrome subunit